MTKAEEKALQKLIDRCNLIGTDVDVYREMNRYKALLFATEEVRDECYDIVVKALGF